MRPHAAALAILFTLLACARGLPPLETAPPLPGEPVAAPEPPPAAPPVGAPREPAAAPGEVRPVPEAPRLPGRVRVGLATDLAEVEIPCCAARLALRAGSRRLELGSATRIEPAASLSAPPVYRLQAAALRAEVQATALARRLAALIDQPGEAVFDARDGLYRVRVGRYPTRAEAERDSRRLAVHGVGGTWVVSEQPRLRDPALEVIQEGRSWKIPGRWLEIVSLEGPAQGIPLDGRRFRGELLVYLNDRGSLNVINRLTLDDYLRGVVPREMGPEVYDHLEALKAQAVAARTYTLRNLGEFGAEGYDICATPRCQVYGGIGSEHALSDRAVRETAGEVLIAADGYADALYSATCGGHTENVEVVFPTKRHAYLRGVPCLEAGTARLAGEASSGLVEAAVLERLVPDGADDAAGFGARAKRLAAMAGLEATAPAPRSLDRRQVHAFLGRLLEIDATPGDGEAAPAVTRPTGWSEEELRLAARLLDSGLMENRRSQRLESAELRRVLFRTAIYLRLVERTDGRFLSLDRGRLRVKRRGGEQGWRVGADVATFRITAGTMRPAPLNLVAGDEVSVYAAGDRLLVLAQRHEPAAGGPARLSRHRAWQHFRSDRELDRLVNDRYPGLGFHDLEILGRGVSGRVSTLRLTGSGGQSVDLDGLPIRWLLELPDTLFTAERTVSAEGEPGWLFRGRGWGHGVGMCQVGAYGMARRGHRYDSILDHYYTGLEIRRLGSLPSPAPAP